MSYVSYIYIYISYVSCVSDVSYAWDESCVSHVSINHMDHQSRDHWWGAFLGEGSIERNKNEYVSSHNNGNKSCGMLAPPTWYHSK